MNNEITKQLQEIKKELTDLKNEATSCHKKICFLEKVLKEVYKHNAKQKRPKT